jgi:hypothetical protein
MVRNDPEVIGNEPKTSTVNDLSLRIRYRSQQELDPGAHVRVLALQGTTQATHGRRANFHEPTHRRLSNSEPIVPQLADEMLDSLNEFRIDN